MPVKINGNIRVQRIKSKKGKTAIENEFKFVGVLRLVELL